MDVDSIANSEDPDQTAPLGITRVCVRFFQAILLIIIFIVMTAVYKLFVWTFVKVNCFLQCLGNNQIIIILARLVPISLILFLDEIEPGPI